MYPASTAISQTHSGMVQFLLAANAQLTKERHHWAPVAESRLEQDKAHEGCEEIPVLIHPMAKGQRIQDKESGDQPDRAFNSHYCLLRTSLHYFTLRLLALGDIFRRVRMPSRRLFSLLRYVIKNRYSHARQHSGCNLSRHERERKTLEDGIKQDHARANHDCGGC